MTFLFLLYSHERGLARDGGGFRKPWSLAEALLRAGHRVHVVGPTPEFSTPVSHSDFAVPSVPLLRPFWAYAAQFILGLFWILRHRPDVVYFRSSLGFLPVRLARWAGARSLMEVNGDAAAEALRDGRPGRARLIRRVEGSNARRADRIVALTDGLAAMLADRYGVSREKISVIPSGTDPTHFHPLDPGVCRRALGLPESAPVVGFIGVFYRHQGVEALLRAAPAILQELPEARFLLAGDGPCRAAWEALARGLGVDRACLFTGQIPYARAPVAVGAMDVAVAPFLPDRGEASPLKILDCAAAGVPVVAHRLDCLEPLAAKLPSVWLVDPASAGQLARAVLDLLKDAPRRRALAGQGREAVEKEFSWERIARRYADACRPS